MPQIQRLHLPERRGKKALHRQAKAVLDHQNLLFGGSGLTAKLYMGVILAGVNIVGGGIVVVRLSCDALHCQRSLGEASFPVDLTVSNGAGHLGVEFGGQIEKILHTGKADAHPPSVAAQEIVGQGVLFPVFPLCDIGADSSLPQPLHDALEGHEGSLGVPVVVCPIKILFQRFRGSCQFPAQIQRRHAVCFQKGQQAVGVCVAVILRPLGHQAAA